VRKKERFISCLDIGTSKICMLIGRAAADGQLEIVGAGYAPSAGLRRGVVVDLEQASESIRQAAQEAETKSDVSVDWVTVGISGDHVQSFNCHGAMSIEGKNNEVTAQDVTQVLAAAQSIPIPPSREVIHVLPQEFFLDNRGYIQNPVGLTGARLDANVHVVTSDSALAQNLVNAVNRAQMRVKKVILQHLASAEAILTKDEKELGSAVIDIGAGTTDVAVIVRDSVRFTATLPVAGAHFTRDLAVGLRTPIEEAERIKTESGSAALEGIAEDEMIEVPGVGTRAARPMMRRTACEILYHRAVELLELARDQLSQAGVQEELMAGAVLTGGGSLLRGLVDLGERILEMPVRQGLPYGVRGLADELSHPIYSTAVGLAMLSAQDSGLFPVRSGRGAGAPWFVNRILSWVGS
jgi:cell division protein FtsA